MWVLAAVRMTGCGDDDTSEASDSAEDGVALDCSTELWADQSAETQADWMAACVLPASVSGLAMEAIRRDPGGRGAVGQKASLPGRSSGQQTRNCVCHGCRGSNYFDCRFWQCKGIWSTTTKCSRSLLVPWANPLRDQR